MYKVILIDDEVGVLQYLPEAFDWESFELEIAGKFADANDALRFMENNPVDAVIVDISMPNMSGIEFAKICYEKHPDVLIVFFSAYKEFEYAKKAIDYRVFAYVTKPISYDEFSEMLGNLSAKLKVNAHQIPGKFTHNENKLVHACVDYLKNHYAEDIRLEDISKAIGFHPAYLSVRYKELAGESIVTTLSIIRIDAAKELIKSGKVKVYAVSEMVGFKSYSYFVKVFKRLCGMNPTEYKNSLDSIDPM